MKQILLTATLFVCTFSACCQLVTDKTFDKLMTDYFNYTILGSQTPTTGFKVETVKPSITLKGNILSNSNRSIITNLELSGGVDEGFMQIISGRNGNTYFKGVLGINWLPRWNNANYLAITPTEQTLNTHSFTANRQTLSQQLDTFLILETIFDDAGFPTYTEAQFIAAVQTLRNNYALALTKFTFPHAGGDQAYYRNLIVAIAALYNIPAPAVPMTFANFQAEVNAGTDPSLQSKKMIKDYDRLKDILFRDKKLIIAEKQADFEIDITTPLWVQKQILWWNLSVESSNSNFHMYDDVKKTLVSDNSFLNGVTLSINFLQKGRTANQFTYAKFGVTGQRVNNLEDLTDFVYKKETTITVDPGETLKSSEEGVAYKGILDHGGGAKIAFELYSVPWNKFALGFYFKSAYKHSEIWINKNKLQVDLGLVWNVTNSDKEAKNILSVIPYFSWSNVLKGYKDATKVEKNRLSDLFKFGLKFGVPINLGTK